MNTDFVVLLENLERTHAVAIEQGTENRIIRHTAGHGTIGGRPIRTRNELLATRRIQAKPQHANTEGILSIASNAADEARRTKQ